MSAIKYILLLFSLMFSVHISAQSVSDLWISMSGEMTPYLSLNQKKEMVECYNAGVDTKVVNQLKGNTLIDTLSVDYAKIVMSESYSLQMVRLPQENNDSIICLVHSYKAPAVQSRLEFYDKDWKQIPSESKMPELEFSSMLVRPDTMSVNRFDELVSLLSPELIRVVYNPSLKKLELSVSKPLTTKEEEKNLQSVISKKLLMWNGVMFK